MGLTRPWLRSLKPYRAGLHWHDCDTLGDPLYQSGLTIREALDSVSKNLYVLPAIQREFVWGPEQISRLFDSLMQGYPFGTFLFWKVQPEKSGQFKFFGFVQNYHERDAPHCPELGTLPNRELTAVLDGQQRLTALNIGLRGSMAMKEPGKWRTNPNAFPKKTLHLDLFALKGEDEEGEAYSFQFKDTEKAKTEVGALWYPVSHIMAITGMAQLSQWLFKIFSGRGLGNDSDLYTRASNTLHRLYEVVHSAPTMTFYTEKSQELDRVLRIFIRMNSGGTVLSYSDLLLSIAVAQWSILDARQEIHELVDQLNKIGIGFNFSKDFVLKAGLMLADTASVGFKVENFNRENMNALESIWPKVREACTLTVNLVSSFGFHEQTLRADSALLPIAYYLFKRQPPSKWISAPAHKAERDQIRSWLIRSLLKSSGIWGSGLDTLLTALRDVIRANHETFPVEQLEKALAAKGKGLSFGAEEIADLLDMEYGDRRVFPLLSLLYPFIDTSQLHHVDHFYPRSALRKNRLEKAGCDSAYAQECVELRDQLPNLMLLEGLINTIKSDKLPSDWMGEAYPDKATRHAVVERHDLGSIPISPLAFKDFFEKRKEGMRDRMVTLLA